MKNFSSQIQGAGVNYINEFYDGLMLDQAQNIKWLEVRPENYLDRGGLGIRMLDEMAEIYPFVAHTVSLSLGSPDPIDWEHLKKIKQFVRKYNIPFLTDHLGTYSYNHVAYQVLLPIPFTADVADYVAKRAFEIQDFLEIPFGFENLVYSHFPFPPQMTETDFINRVIEKSGCQFLLDINDVFINSHNYKFDPKVFLDSLNLKSCIEIHISGHTLQDNNFYAGEHASAISEESFALLDSLGHKKSLPPLLFEWENSPPQFDIIVQQIQRLNQIWQASITQNLKAS